MPQPLPSTAPMPTRFASWFLTFTGSSGGHPAGPWRQERGSVSRGLPRKQDATGPGVPGPLESGSAVTQHGTMSLTPRQRQYLKALGHHLSPVIQVGHKGLTAELAAETARALDAHELIKVKFMETAPGERHALGEDLATQTGAQVCQVIGRTALLYRPRPADPVIELPRETASGPAPKRTGKTNGQKQPATPRSAPKGRKAARR